MKLADARIVTGDMAVPSGRAMDLKERLRKRTGGVLIFVSGALLIFSATMKFAGVPGVVQPMAAVGFAGPKLLFIGGLEVLSAVLYWIPVTRAVGVLLVSAYLGGAICTHVQADEYLPVIPAALILALAWTGAALRHHAFLWSFSHIDPVQR